MASELQQFVIMPARGMHASTALSSPMARSFLTAHLSGSVTLSASAARGLAKPKIRILDSIHEDGPKLIEASHESAMALRGEQPGLRVVPVVYFKPALAPRPKILAKPKPAGAAVGTKITIQVVSKKDGKGVAGAQVVAFTDFANRLGADGKTNRKGEVSLNLGSSSKKLDRLYVYPELAFWSLLKKKITVTSGNQFALTPLEPAGLDAVRFFYGDSDVEYGQGITVAVVDSGVDTAQPDLAVAGGLNTVQGENAAEFGDNGGHHGTHVAGIIAARGMSPAGRLGVAPAVTLRSYRVFGKNSDGASNFAIAKAIDRAVTDGCDLINMSLGGGDADPLTRAAIADARGAGALVIVAAGNDDRSPVSWPAADDRAVAISALGRKGTFPSATTESSDVAAPFGKDKKNFIAAFSNIGMEIDLTGPGVGIISTVPGGYAVMSGTSMACPAVTGIAARILAKRQDIYELPRDQQRSDAIAQALFNVAKSLGFKPQLEGHGLPA
jgi:subtilisin